jgi:hypothetical protein
VWVQIWILFRIHLLGSRSGFASRILTLLFYTVLYRVETKIFVFAFSQKFIFVFAKISWRKLTKIAEIFAEMQNLLFSPHILIFWEHFCQLFYFKMPTLINSIQSDAPLPKYSTSIMITPLASIFVKKLSRKFLHFRENFHIFAKISRKCEIEIFVSALMAIEF